MNRVFIFNERLGLNLPQLDANWEDYSDEEQASIVEQWEIIRGRIPDLVIRFEHQINVLQIQMNEEDDFDKTCTLNSNIADLASRINDLHIWYRINQELEGKRHS
ncbi:hypothetical protein FHS18_000261 [Paenibacillus phyllosphaerae]|uniref:Uncharacterized protein n=1 Tax=Paenibacillus phyllosphaerae TaxID=274593 RepID=A0A7W5AT72_9BACL|nr:hypothetical protein [Paenibacillus phyllosphaerae]